VESADLLSNIAVALALALLGGVAARALHIPTVLGYLAAGAAISPFSPGPSADIDALREVAELGVIFLMFGIGLSFDLRELATVRAAALPGALCLITLTTSAGFGIGRLFGLNLQTSLVVGFAIAVSSSAVLSRALDDRGLVHSVAGRLAIGWSVVEDLGTVLILALLPSLGGGGGGAEALRDTTLAVGKATLFVGIMFLLGAYVIPPLLRYVARFGSRELFILAVVSLALGIAAGATAFDVSVAVGAFIAGVVISETEMGHQATADVIPLREAFAVLFFVSVGMLLDPAIVVHHLPLLVALVAVVVVGRSLVTVLLFAFFPFSGRTALLVGAGVGQIGEFSFLIADAGFEQHILNSDIYNVLLATAVAAIALNPLLWRLLPAGEGYLQGFGPLWRAVDRQGPVPEPPAPMHGHVVILGYGRVGELSGHALDSVGVPFVVIEGSLELARRLQRLKQPVVWGDATSTHVLTRAHLKRARLLISALPDENSTLLAITNARRIAPDIPIVVRARKQEEMHMLRALAVQDVVVPEFEGGLELMRQALLQLGYSDDDVDGYRVAIRDVHYGAADPAHL
jgi:CPA2 family monovalent cation:H+ antiporter-2